MEWLDYLRFLAALMFVLALIGGLAWLARRSGLSPRARPSGQRGRRLAIAEVMALDGKRRLVLVQRDGVEHLLLLGQGGDLLVESGIRPAAETRHLEVREAQA